MNIIEPQWGVTLLQNMNNWASGSIDIFHVVSFFADAIVFLFPIFLLVAYIVWIIKKNQKIKIYSLRIFSAAAIAALINIIIQFFLHKPRPETVLEWTQRLILKHLPTMSFPSDHAAVSMAFAVAILVWVAMYKKLQWRKIFYIIGIFFLIAWVVMSVCRVAVGIHWPTDILAWWWVGIIAWFTAYSFSEKILDFIVGIEERIMQKLWVIKK